MRSLINFVLFYYSNDAVNNKIIKKVNCYKN